MINKFVFHGQVSLCLWCPPGDIHLRENEIYYFFFQVKGHQNDNCIFFSSKPSNETFNKCY